jgi:hypothetical protein
VGRLIALVLGGFGLGAYFQSRRRRHPALDHSPALELKAKLAESRTAIDPEPPAPVAPEPGREPEGEREPDAEPTLEDDLAARRRTLHEQARGAIDELS